MTSRNLKLLITTVAVFTLAATPTANATTYTLEPWDFDGVLGINMNITPLQLDGALCPCVKIPYPADALHNQQGAAAIAATPLKPGDVVLGFSNGSVVASTYLAKYTPPPGVQFILLGDSIGPNSVLKASGVADWFGSGVPTTIGNPVNLVTREYDGWADWPDNVLAPGYLLAVINAWAGAGIVHDYRTVDINDSANVVSAQGNITNTLVPTATLPINDGWRQIGLPAVADWLDGWERPLIDAAYTRPASTTATPVPSVDPAPKVSVTTKPEATQETRTGVTKSRHHTRPEAKPAGISTAADTADTVTKKRATGRSVTGDVAKRRGVEDSHLSPPKRVPSADAESPHPCRKSAKPHQSNDTAATDDE